MPIDKRTIADIDKYLEMVINSLKSKVKKGPFNNSYSMEIAKAKISPAKLRDMLCPNIVSEKLFDKIIGAYTDPPATVVEVRQFFIGLIACCAGSTDEKLIYCFSLYDTDHDGSLNKFDLSEMLETLAKLNDFHSKLIRSESTLMTMDCMNDDSKRPNLPILKEFKSSDFAHGRNSTVDGTDSRTKTQNGSTISDDSPVNDSRSSAKSLPQESMFNSANKALKGSSEREISQLNQIMADSASSDALSSNSRSHQSRPKIRVSVNDLPKEYTGDTQIRQVNSSDNISSKLMSYWDHASPNDVNRSVVQSNKWNEPIEDVDELVRTLYASLELDEKNFISINDYLRWIHRNPSAVIFLDKIKHITNVSKFNSPHNHLINEEREIIESLMNNIEWKVGDECHILSIKWWRLWCEYVNFSTDIETDRIDIHDHSGGTPPHSVDNFDLLLPIEDNTSDISGFLLLRDNLMPGVDFIVVSKEIWNTFLSWYGGGPTIVRQISSYNASNTHLSGRDRFSISLLLQKSMEKVIVDLYPIVLGLGFFRDQKAISKCICSIEISISDLKSLVCQQLNISSGSDIKFWAYFADTDPLLLNEDHITVREAGLTNGHLILVSGRQKFERNSPSTNFVGWMTKNVLSPGPISPNKGSGLVGLQNMGNTCYMNAALQCLTHTTPLVHYFLEDLHIKQFPHLFKADNNITNEFAKLVKQIWKARNYSNVVPQSMRLALIRKRPQFSGFHQNDSQEVLGIFLEDLHNDLNSIKSPVSHENPDYDGQSDEDLSSIYWMNHLRRDASLIVSMFQGQFKTHLQCTSCYHEIVKYHPFLFLSVSLPENHQRSFSILLIPSGTGQPPLLLKVNVSKAGKAKDLVDEIKKLLGPLSSDRIYPLADIQNHYIFSFIPNTRPLEEIRERDTIYAYEVDPEHVDYIRENADLSDKTHASENFKVSRIKLTLLNRRLKTEWSLQRKKPRYFLFGIPLYIYRHVIGSVLSGRELYEIVAQKFASVFNLGPFLEEFKDKNSDVRDTPISPKSPSARASLSYPFVLKYVGSNGLTCSKCTSENHMELVCQGCAVIESDDPVDLSENDSLAVEWHVKKSNLSFSDLSKILEKIEKHPSSQMDDVDSSSLNLDQIIREYEKPELMSSDDFYCPKCKCSREGIKRETIWKAPPFLMVQLKRFSYTMTGCIKNDRKITFPVQNLNINPYLTKNAEGENLKLTSLLPFLNPENNHPPFETKNQEDLPAKNYNLYAFISHIGSFSDGHYVCHWKDLDKSKWYFFNDHICKEINFDEPEISSNQAYVLFYQYKETPSLNHLIKEPEEDLKRLEAKYGSYDQKEK